MTSLSKRVIPIRSLSSREDEAPAEEKDTLEEKKKEVMSKKREADAYYEETRQQADLLLQEAKEQIEKEKEDWKEKKRQLSKQAEEQGYKDGYIQGQQDGEAQYASLINRVNEVILKAEEVYKQKISDAEEDILHIAMQAGKKILGHSLEGDPTQFRFLVAEAVKEVTEQSTISIYVHPEYFEEISSYWEELNKIIDGQAQIYVYVKHFTDPAQCYIESPFGRIDASIDTQLELIREAIIEVAREGE